MSNLVEDQFEQAKLTGMYSTTPEYAVAIPALKALASSEGGLRRTIFNQLLSIDHPHLLESLIKSDIVSSVGGVVNFQSRATKWYAESRLKHAGGGETHRRRW